MTPATVCAVHAPRPAVGACARCGTFGCEQCLPPQSVERVCAACLQRQVAHLPPLESRALLARIALWAAGAAGLMLAGASELPLSDSGPLVALLVGLVGLGYLTLLVGTIVVFCLWFHLAVRYGLALGLMAGDTPGFAVGSWFIPFVNLFVPFNIARQLDGSAPVGAWQALWIIGDVASRLSRPAFGGVVPFIGPALLLGAALAGADVVKRITERIALHTGPQAPGLR